MANDNNQANIANLFSGVSWVPGLGYVGGAQASGRMGNLGDDASVMMISGLGAADDQRQMAVNPDTGVVQNVTGAGLNAMAALKQPVTIGGLTLPLWAWLLVGAGVLGTAGYFLLFHKKK